MSVDRRDNPLIVQSDYTILVEVNSPRYVAARDALARFAELVKSPEHFCIPLQPPRHFQPANLACSVVLPPI